MKFDVEYISFFVIQVEGEDGQGGKQSKHYQTMDGDDYSASELSAFLDGEFAKTAKRKAERNPKSEQVPTKIGRFVVEPGYDLDSNPNYNMFARLRTAETIDSFMGHADELVTTYMNASAIRGGAMFIVRAKANQYFDEPFLFVFKCDFEQKIARITDERSLLNKVEMAINAKNMKSIMYPHMPEPGMMEVWELKIHQSSHARYFEDFLKFVEYEKSVPELMSDQVLGFVQQYVEQVYEDHPEEKERELEEMELWAHSEKRELQEKWDQSQVIEAASMMVEQKPDLEMKLKLGNMTVKALLADFGDRLHIAKLGDRYVVVLEGDGLEFDRGISPVELLMPEPLDSLVGRLKAKARDEELAAAALPY
ncbi:DUF3900 domain-containing protein [Paenibacillus naphthalenovorans]|uniref:Uncharacterized protein n=1 Tax=Paenibacillus naphthalenovorans TaxID=162209 RepID=A0A0U2UGW9_9BACL|nr:DUF3900 domain-containing protein [Paenibacillus naphthalenovorans]ALS22412.1 hypothetical protein IJ22_20380 [Paenibacillus naphthalenovorans]GCL70199.1 hypothetical protein PN4B1_00990 [Paenibacillus naphthalenovorans]